jgi:mannosylglycerate hydrolase
MLRFAALKKAEDRNTFVVRLYNPTGVLQRGRLLFVAALDRAWETNLNEKREHELKVTKSNELLVTANPYKIVTVEVKTKQRAV